MCVITFTPSDDIEAAFESATRGSEGDGGDGDGDDAPVVSNRIVTAKMGRSQLDGLIRAYNGPM